MRIEDWLGEDNQLGIDIWHRKYQRNGETFDQWLDRVSINNQYIRNLIIGYEVKNPEVKEETKNSIDE